ncbi:MAG: substrate-binding domain-containing protein [Clostridiales bacterium]|jgi:tungstate transport system substrate-binding protein|nr:substrate-binding domain-containing protein [Clostridiales bacterium]
MRKLFKMLIVLLLAAFLAGCGQPAAPGMITLATTSTEDSGLLDFILPYFTEDTGWEIRVISVGTGAAMQLGRDGEADVLLVHARSEEDRFVAEGYATRRYDVMYNDFVIVGPGDGPIGHNNDVHTTFTAILEQNLTFVSRGDNSGTHIRELEIWDALGLTPEDNSGYTSVGQGMGATLGMTVEMRAYTLVDRATWLSFPDVGDLIIICEGHADLLNPYGLLPVSTTLLPEGARAFIDWMTSPRGQELIAEFGLEEFGQPLFFPEAE